MKLQPPAPPGRANRKARAYQPEIARLRFEGYTCEAIRRALADSGLEVSLSTVQREAAWQARRPPVIASQLPSALPRVNARPTSIPPAVASSTLAVDPRSGKEIAATFMKDVITNPLVRARIAHESGRH